MDSDETHAIINTRITKYSTISRVQLWNSPRQTRTSQLRACHDELVKSATSTLDSSGKRETNLTPQCYCIGCIGWTTHKPQFPARRHFGTGLIISGPRKRRNFASVAGCRGFSDPTGSERVRGTETGTPRWFPRSVRKEMEERDGGVQTVEKRGATRENEWRSFDSGRFTTGNDFFPPFLFLWKVFYTNNNYINIFILLIVILF